MRAVILKLTLITVLLVTSVLWNISMQTLVQAAEQAAHTVTDLKQQIAEQFLTHDDSFTVYYKGDTKQLRNSISSLISDALYEDDYIAYILDSYAYTMHSKNDISILTIKASYRETKEQTAIVQQETTEALGRILRPGMTDEEKVKAIHDFVVKSLAYDESHKYYTAYEGLLYGKAVCQGYALLVYKLLTEAGIPSRIIEGTVSSGDHAWNLVQIQGHWYHLDATWDDPLPDRKDRVVYSYYLKTDAEMSADHHWNRSYPTANTEYVQQTLQVS